MKEVDESGEFKYLIEKKVNSFLSKIDCVCLLYHLSIPFCSSILSRIKYYCLYLLKEDLLLYFRSIVPSVIPKAFYLLLPTPLKMLYLYHVELN